MTATQLAQHYGLTSSIAINKLLEKCGIVKNTDNGYVLSPDLRGRGYISVIEVPFFLPSGFRAKRKQAVWTQAGIAMVHHALVRFGIVPVSEQKDLFSI